MMSYNFIVIVTLLLATVAHSKDPLYEESPSQKRKALYGPQCQQTVTSLCAKGFGFSSDDCTNLHIGSYYPCEVVKPNELCSRLLDQASCTKTIPNMGPICNWLPGSGPSQGTCIPTTDYLFPCCAPKLNFCPVKPSYADPPSTEPHSMEFPFKKPHAHQKTGAKPPAPACPPGRVKDCSSIVNNGFACVMAYSNLTNTLCNVTKLDNGTTLCHATHYSCNPSLPFTSLFHHPAAQPALSLHL